MPETVRRKGAIVKAYEFAASQLSITLFPSNRASPWGLWVVRFSRDKQPLERFDGLMTLLGGEADERFLQLAASVFAQCSFNQKRLGVCLPGQPGGSVFHLVGYPNVRIRQMKANFFYIVQALVHIKVGLGIAPVQIESLERGPWSELRGQVPANVVSGKTEDAPDASKNMHLHSYDPPRCTAPMIGPIVPRIKKSDARDAASAAERGRAGQGSNLRTARIDASASNWPIEVREGTPHILTPSCVRLT